MKTRFFTVLLAFALVAGACGETTPPTDFDVSNFLVTPGATESGSIDIDGTAVDYVITLPNDFAVGDTAPVLLAFPPGGQDLEITRNTVEFVYAQEALRLGWVVVSPAAPNGDLFFDGGEDVLPGFVNWIEAWVTPEGGAPHVAGISNGGLSAFRYAGENPGRLLSLVAFPGFARTGGDRDALAELTEIPVRIYVGGTDTAWIDGAEETVDVFVRAGGDIQLQTFPGEGHVIQSTSDGTIVFEQLERFRLR